MFTADDKMTEPQKVLAIIEELECWRLGNWDGCCCSHFSIRNVDVRISCGKGDEQAVWVSSRSFEYDDKELLRPILREVVRQVTEQSNRGGSFAEYIDNT